MAAGQTGDDQSFDGANGPQKTFDPDRNQGMPDPVTGQEPETLTAIIRMAPGIALAMLGAAVKVLRSDEPFSLRGYVIGLTTAAFAACVMACYLEWAQVNHQLRIVLIGITGYMARDTLDYLTKFAKRWMKVTTSAVSPGAPLPQVDSNPPWDTAPTETPIPAERKSTKSMRKMPSETIVTVHVSDELGTEAISRVKSETTKAVAAAIRRHEQAATAKTEVTERQGK